MLEELLIFTRGGLILWSSCRALGVSAALKGSPIDALIRSCLLEERSADASFSEDTYALKWTFNNDLGLVFVAVYQRMLHLLYVDDLLAAVRREFSQIYDPRRVAYDDVFTDVFRQLHLEAEARAEAMKKTRQSALPPSSRAPAASGGKKPARIGPQGVGKKGGAESGKDDSSDGADSGKERQSGGKLTNVGSVKGRESGAKKAAATAVADDNGKENGDPNGDGAFDVNTLRKKMIGKKKKNGAVVGKKAVAKAEPKKNVKQKRVWEDQPPKIGKLDFTDPADERGDEEREQAIAHQGDSTMDKDEALSSDSEEDEEEDGEENADAGQKTKKGWFTSMFKRMKKLQKSFVNQ